LLDLSPNPRSANASTSLRAILLPATLVADIKAFLETVSKGRKAILVAHDWGGLWILAIIYFTLAVISAFLVKRRLVHG